MLKSDNKGFLIPDSAVGVNELTHGINGIKRDTGMLIKLLKGQAKSTVLQRARVVSQNNRSRTSVNPGGGGAHERDSRGRFIRDSAHDEVGRAVQQMTRQQAQQAAIEKRAEAAKQNREGNAQSRDSRGRFGAGEGDDKGDKDGLFARLKSVFSDKGGAGDLDNVDPAIEAANEMKSMVGGAIGGLKSVGELGNAVIGRGFNGEGKDKAVPWYRRMLQQLKLMRKDEGEFSKAQIKAIKGVKTGSGGGGSDRGGLFSSLTGMLGGVGGGLLSGAGAGLMKMGGGLLKRIPLLGGLLAGGSALVSAFSDDDPNKSPEENRKERFSGVGSGVGALIGGGIGLLGGPVGAVAGGMVGDKVGGIVGEKLSAVDWKDVGEKIAAGASTVTVPIGKALTAAKDWVLGKTSKFFESGNGGAGTVSTGKGDNGGASYGTYQLSSKAGTLNEFLKSSKYGKEFDGLQPGSPEFNAKWRQVAADNPDFGTAQHDFIKQTHFDPQQKKLQNAGIDLSGRGAAVQDAIWSTSNQFGGNTSLIKSALEGKDASSMSDAEIVSAIQDYKIANNDTLFSKSNRNNRAGTLNRAKLEKNSLIALANSAVPGALTASAMPPIAMTPAALSALSSPARIPSVVVSAPSLPAPAPRSDIPVPLNSKGPIEVTVKNDQLANRDVRDRRLAQIATGNAGYQ